MTTKPKKQPAQPSWQYQQEYHEKNKENIQERKKAYYEQHKEEKKKRRRELYWQKKKAAQAQPPVYDVSGIKILMRFQEYSELSKEKRELVKRFWDAMKELVESGYLHDIDQVGDIEAKAGNLRRDFLATAKGTIRKRARSWGSLSEQAKKEFLAYVARKRALEVRRAEGRERELDEEAQELEKEIARELDVDAFHRERGKINCVCAICHQAKKAAEKLLDEAEQRDKKEKEECVHCGKSRKLNEEELCQKCAEEFSEY